jgi:aryl-alcohol dehydrogenase-like predicted oxidoreductase
VSPADGPAAAHDGFGPRCVAWPGLTGAGAAGPRTRFLLRRVPYRDFNDAHEPGDARQAIDGTLKALGTGYVDLFLIHWPLPTRYGGDFVQTWRVLEEAYREGRARSIGVSDFQPRHLRRLHGKTEVIPAVNQIEVHPYLTQDDVRAFCAEHQIAVEAWGRWDGELFLPTRSSVRSPTGSARPRLRSCPDTGMAPRLTQAMAAPACAGLRRP